MTTRERSIAPDLDNVTITSIAIFPKPDAETFRGPEWDDAKLLAWVTYYQRTRAESIEAANDRTDGTVAYCTFRMDGMLAELARRKALARRFKDDPRGPRWSVAGGRERGDLVDFVQDLKIRWPIDRFMTELMMVQLRPSGRNRWTCRCVSPAHRDSEPSMTVYGADNHVFCHGCRYYGDVIDLAALHFGLTSLADAVRKLAEVGAAGEVMAS